MRAIVCLVGWISSAKSTHVCRLLCWWTQLNSHSCASAKEYDFWLILQFEVKLEWMRCRLRTLCVETRNQDQWSCKFVARRKEWRCGNRSAEHYQRKNLITIACHGNTVGDGNGFTWERIEKLWCNSQVIKANFIRYN